MVLMEYYLPAGALDLLQRVREGGVVLDYVVARMDQDPSDERVLRELVEATVAGFAALRGLESDRDVEVASIPGARISVDDFYGWGIDRRRRRVMRRGWELCREHPERYTGEPLESGTPLMIPWVWSDEPTTPIESSPGGRMFGYVLAFLEPPYDLRMPPDEAVELFFSIDELLLGGPDDATEIWRFESGMWPPEAWSPYFEGNWFGGCVWTVRRSQDEVTVIGAAASD
jgi:hypothetical protein